MRNNELNDRYVNPYTDFGFKKLFGTEMNKDLLISFINSLLSGEEVITDLTYLNTEHLGTSEADRKAVFDVYCENNRGEKILVEMQRGEQRYFKDRSIYYASFPIREQGKKGEWNYELKAVYIIGILNFVFDDENNDYYHHEVQLIDKRTPKVFYDKLTFIYFRPKALQERVFKKLFEAAEIAKFSKQEYDAYEDSLKVYRDWKSTVETAEFKGHERGLEEGLVKGRKEQAIEFARLMKASNEPLEKIIQYTHLTEEEISKL